MEKEVVVVAGKPEDEVDEGKGEKKKSEIKIKWRGNACDAEVNGIKLTGLIWKQRGKGWSWRLTSTDGRMWRGDEVPTRDVARGRIEMYMDIDYDDDVPPEE